MKYRKGRHFNTIIKEHFGVEEKFDGLGIGDSKFKNPSIWDGCSVCGLKGINGYVCSNTACLVE